MTALSPELPVWDPPVAYRFAVAMGMSAAPYSAELFRALQHAAAEAGCEVVLADTGDTVSEEAAVVRAQRADRVDGLLLVPAAGDDAVVNGLVRMGVPTVVVDRLVGRNDVDQVGSENVQSVCALVRHLADRRHRKIALISGDAGLCTTEERTFGYRSALNRLGLRWNSDLVVCGQSTPGGAARVAGQLLDSWPSPTAMVVTDEAMLIGVQYEAHRRGIRLGSELALVGFGDAGWARQADPAVTIMAQPIQEIARKAVHLLRERVTDPEKRPEAVRLSPRFIHGASCGC